MTVIETSPRDCRDSPRRDGAGRASAGRDGAGRDSAGRDSATVVRPATVGDMIALRTLGAGERRGTTLVVVCGGWVVGAVDVVALPDSDAAMVCRLFVRSPHRNRGLARMLLRGACANVVAQGKSWVAAFMDGGDDRAHRLFASCGWRPDPGGNTSDPRAVVVYRRRVLTSAFSI